MSKLGRATVHASYVSVCQGDGIQDGADGLNLSRLQGEWAEGMQSCG